MHSILQDWIRDRATAWQSCRLHFPLSVAEGAAVERVVGGAAVIGLGEMTHGSKTLLDARARLLKHLVERCGVRIIVLETNFAGTLPLDDYVVSGNGVALAALAATEYWSTVNRETLELVEWLRDYNRRSLGRRGPVRVWGCDVQSVDHAKSELKRRLFAFERTGLLPAGDCDSTVRALDSVPGDRELYQQVEALLAEGAARPPNAEKIAVLQSRRAAYMAAAVETTAHVAGLLRTLHGRPGDMRGRDDSFVFERCARLLEQAVRFYSPYGELDRDSLMAENLHAIRSHFRGDKLAILAHNLHVMRTPLSIRGHRFESLGYRLAQEFQDDYKAVGSAFYQGTFVASPGGSPEDTDVAQALLPRADSWEHHCRRYCDAVGARGAWLSFDRKSSAEGPAWPDLPMRLGEAGDQGTYEDSFLPQNPPVQYDGLLFVSETTEISILPEYYAIANARWGAEPCRTP